MLKAIVLFLTSLLSIQSATAANLPSNFIFGVANAPAQVEDGLNDIWFDWAKLGHVAGWNLATQPNERLQFWSHPETELDLAKNLGVGAFRMGVDWERVMPRPGVFDEKAIAHYHEIFRATRARNMRVMLTLFHHSLPKWFQAMGGWHKPENKKYFIQFAERMIGEYHDEVSWWVTFNEANIFALMAYTSGAWPPGEQHSPLVMLPILGGSSAKALDLMADAHNEVYEWAHAFFPKIMMGLAHNMAHYKGDSLLDRGKALLIDNAMNWHLPERIRGHMDFFGMNYYGAEWINGNRVDVLRDDEYSEAGRAVDVNGFLTLLREIHSRFPSLPIAITENGIADANDGIRSAFVIEHLTAIQQAIGEKIPVQAYFIWTLTDNLEWSDGYCPKFGLVAVDRQTMKRTPRTSYGVFRQIATSKSIDPRLRQNAWNRVVRLQGTLRPFCRADDGATGLATPKLRRYSHKDWRFNLSTVE